MDYYINDDAPRAFIRGYRVGRQDWYLFPPGDIVANPPGARDGSYYEDGQALARAQQARARECDDRPSVPTSK